MDEQARNAAGAAESPAGVDVSRVARRVLLGDGSVAAVLEPLSGAIAAALVETLREALRQVSDAYDGNPGHLVLGPPEEARAWVALRDHADSNHFLRVFGGSGEGALIEQIAGLALPVEEFAAVARRRDEHRKTGEEIERPLTGLPDERAGDPPCFDWMTIRELHEWRETWVAACQRVASYQAERAARGDLVALARGANPDESSESCVLAELDAADLLVLAAAAETPRGFASGDRELYRRLQAIRKRVRRHHEKFSVAVSE